MCETHGFLKNLLLWMSTFTRKTRVDVQNIMVFEKFAFPNVAVHKENLCQCVNHMVFWKIYFFERCGCKEMSANMGKGSFSILLGVVLTSCEESTNNFKGSVAETDPSGRVALGGDAPPMGGVTCWGQSFCGSELVSNAVCSGLGTFQIEFLRHCVFSSPSFVLS